MSAPAPSPRSADDSALLIQRHVRFGWWTLLVFLLLGMVLETLHGFKVAAYLNVSNETRRLLWTLAHAHGTLLGLLNLAFAFTIARAMDWPARPRGISSACLRAATLLLPAGFFLAGFFLHSGDPGAGIVLVPIGAILLLIAVFLAAIGAGRSRTLGTGKSK